MKTINQSDAPRQTSPVLAHVLSWVAVGVASTIAGYGVYFKQGEWSFNAIMLCVVIALTEAGALILVMTSRPKGSAKIAAVMAAFTVLEGWNAFVGHEGLVAMDQDGVNRQRAPFEKALTMAETDLTSAQGSLVRFDAETLRQADDRSSILKGASGDFLKAKERTATENEQAAKARDALRDTKQKAADAASVAVKTAKLNLANAPKPIDQNIFWVGAVLFILLKGAMVWLTRSGPEVVTTGVTRLTREEADGMDVAGLEALQSLGMSIAATAKNAIARKGGQKTLRVVG